MFCSNCGKLVNKEEKYCAECGEIIEMDIPLKSPSKKKKPFKKTLFFKLCLVLLLLFVLYLLFWNVILPFVLGKLTIGQEVLVESVVNVVCDDGEEVWGGSGTIITSDGLILTNSHVIPQNEETLLTGDYGCLISVPDPYSGQPSRFYWGEPIVFEGISDVYDLAFIEIYDVYTDDEGQSYGEFPTKFSSILDDENMHDIICDLSSPSFGDQVRVYGYPASSGGYNLTITEGVISSFDEEGFILTSAKIDSGNSGGLAVDERGCMLGVPVALREGIYQNMGVIISTDLIFDFVDALDNL